MLPEPIEATRSLNAYLRYLEDTLEFIPIGEGYKARAFLTNENTVIKVAVNDAGYDAFLEVALANQDDPSFPKIYHVARYKNVKQEREWNMDRKVNVTVVTMEKLEPSGTEGEIASSLLMAPERRWATHSQTEIRKVKRMMRKSNFIQACRKIKHLFMDYSEDMHGGNLMLRGQQLVITDPLVGAKRFSF